MIMPTNANARDLSDELRAESVVLREKALVDSGAFEIVASLTMEVGPRSAGSAGDAAAVLWAKEMLSSIGFANVRGEAVTVPHWDRGTLDVRLTTPFSRLLVATSLGGSTGTPEGGIEAPVLRVESLSELRQMTSEEVSGHVVFIDHVMARLKSGGGYSAAARIRVCGHVVAAERGALATVIRSAGTSTHRFAHTGSMLYDLTEARIPAVALSNADADILAHAVQSGEPTSIRLRSSARYLPDAQSSNVIGEIPGQGANADEIVLLGAHLDSWDLGMGAIDDGAGVAAVIAAAKLILNSGNRPSRTIRVVLFANEEFGLSGAKAYALEHSGELNQHVMGLEADSGAGPVWLLASRVAESGLNLVDQIHALLAPLNIERGDNSSTNGADLGPLRVAGMPILEMRQDNTEYFDYHHTIDDTLDKIDPKNLDQLTAAIAVAANVAANADGDFGRLAPVQAPTATCVAD